MTMTTRGVAMAARAEAPRRGSGSLPAAALLGLALTLPGGARAEGPELGRIDFKTSGSPAAQSHFLRGALLLHSFEYSDAAEEFRQAQAAEPGFAMAYWGEAMTYNHPLWKEQDRDAAERALGRLASTSEARLAKAPTEREKMYLGAVEALYGQGGRATRDAAYADAMRRLHERFPDDLDASALYALSLLGSTEGKRDFAVYMKAAAILEDVFAKNPEHPGAAHYLIHCYDDPVHAPLGMRAARVYARIAPAAVHALHMPSHIFFASGMWQEAVASNEASWKASVDRAERLKLSAGEHSFHALSWLEYAYLQLGRKAEARRTLATMEADAAASPSGHTGESLSSMRAVWIVETGDCSADVLPAADASEPKSLFVRGLCALASGERAGAEKALEAMKAKEPEASEAGEHAHGASMAGVSSGRVRRDVSGVLQAELEAKIALARGEIDRAVELAREATLAEDAMTFEFGPPVVVKPAHELMGEILLGLDRPVQARAEFEAALAHAPGRALSLRGLEFGRREGRRKSIVRLAPGTRLGPYEILGPLGAGGMGEVYRARDPRLGREVAIKVLPEDVASDRERLSRFEREARSASALNHPNVVSIYDFGHSSSVFYIAMELVEGKTVRELIAEGTLPLRKLLQIGSQTAEGLARAHSGGIVHRDLKPENLMVSRDGFVKILDFGLAKVAVAPESGKSDSQLATSDGLQTGRGLVLGTTAYMSPEQSSGRPLDFRSDQFSLGCVLYEMATGKRPFQRESVAETLAAIIREEPEPMVSVNARLPAPLCWIVERCLAKDPEERYASTRDLAQDLAAVRDRFEEVSPSARPTQPVKLPAPRTGFVGRAREQAALKEILRKPDVALMTLTGPGGIGKTRLGLEVAREMAEDFPGGVHFVPLAPVSDPDAIATAISQALGLRAGASGPPLTALREYLHTSVREPMLLLLDGFEHLISAASLVAELVEAGRNLKILVTSRSPLHIYGEHEYPVPPLAVPDRTAGFAELSRADAVSLFFDRAVAVKPDFAVTEENAVAIAEICARLDGLPLAIELAAARIKLLSPAAMRTRLEKRLQLLTGGARDLPARQQTLRGAIDWSHELLGPAEQRLFRRFAVFVGGCTLEAAEAVCDTKSDLGLDLLEGVDSLMDKSLLQKIEPARGEPRFVMLETIREYGLERLASSGEEPLTRRAHAAYFVVLAEDSASERSRGVAGSQDPAPRSAEDSSGWLDRLELEHDNFRAALDWLIENGESDWGLRLGAALFQFWEEREYLAEGHERLEKLLSLPGAAAHTKARSRALFAAGVLAGEPAAARAFHQEALSINRELEDQRGVAVELNALAVGAQLEGDLPRARELLEESIVLWRGLKDPVAVVRGLSNLASVAGLERHFGEALALFEECLSISRQLGDRAGMAWALDHKGDVAREQGDTASARSFYEQSLAMFRELGDRWGIAGSLGDLGNLEREQGAFESARHLYQESLEVFRELDHKRGIARLLDCFACSAAAESHPERALRLAGAAAALREALGAPLTPPEQVRLSRSLEPARQALTNVVSASAWMEGWAMSVETAIAVAIAPESA